MGRMRFDSSGKLIGVDETTTLDQYSESIAKENGEESKNWDEEYISEKLKKSSDLNFLKETEEDIKEGKAQEIKNIFDREYWSLFSGESELKPLKFSNGKTQEDIVKEVVDLVKSGKKIIFLHGTCGTGKSAIALNIARVLGRASIVVPVKALQKQYEDDYMNGMYLMMNSKRKMRIAMITGRDNHDSIFFQGKSCADPNLPENIKITEKNQEKLREYYEKNPFIKNKDLDIDRIRRMSIAPSNPYWSPILPSNFEAKQLKDADKRKYRGCDGKEYVFYHRKRGCSYYDQYLSYIIADTIIFNSAKYLAELEIGRKPETEVDIVDEADEFLDSLFAQEEINLTKLKGALRLIFPENSDAGDRIDHIIKLIELEEKNKKALGIDENRIYQIDETKIKEIFLLLKGNAELEAEIALDELNYSNKILEIARGFSGILSEVYLSYRKDDDSLCVKLVSTNLKPKIDELMAKSKALVFMSGTLHSSNILKKVFKIEDYGVVEAETLNFGNVEIIRTGEEFDCKHFNFSSGNKTRKDYLIALSDSVDLAKIPFLVHVNAFQDLPSEKEIIDLKLWNLISHEKLKEMQKNDKTGKLVSMFKQGLSDKLFTTKCSRGVDFPGEMCNSIIFTKYPNPNIQDTFWKVLNKMHPEYFWDFYRDKAKREFLQRLYRALRSKKDHVYVLSPDERVLEAVQELQRFVEKQVFV